MSNQTQGLSRMQQAVIFSAIVVAAMCIGGIMLEAVFGGVITLIGLIVLIESMSTLKWLMYKFSRPFDLVIFVFGIYATVQCGVTIALSLTVTGIGYTMLYAPYVRETYNLKPQDNAVSNPVKVKK